MGEVANAAKCQKTSCRKKEKKEEEKKGGKSLAAYSRLKGSTVDLCFVICWQSQDSAVHN